MYSILLIGGCGYIGSSLYNYLIKNNKITIVDKILFGNYHYNVPIIEDDYNNLSKEFVNSFDIVILAAAHSSVNMTLQSPFFSLKNNIYNFIELSNKISNKQKFIYFSSSSVYGNISKYESTELTEIISPINEYDIQKYIIDKYIEKTNLNYYGLRLGTVNGSSLNTRIDIMINAMVNNCIENKKLIVSNKDIYRPILYINDLCRAIEVIINSNNDYPGLYNLASFNDTVDNISKKVSSIMNIPIIYKEDLSHPYNFKISSNKFIDTFKFEFLGNTEVIVNDILCNFNNINKDHRNYKINDINIKNDCKEKTFCRVCKNKNLKMILDLDSQPLANNYHLFTYPQQYYPLKLMLCDICYHSQLSHMVDPKILYSNYQYVSGTSKTLIEYFKWLANKIKMESIGTELLEIACNDGSQLNIFKDLGYSTYGCDPAENIVKNIKNHTIYNEFFSLSTAKKINKKFDIIVAQNVLAHLDDVDDFLQGCYLLLKEEGTLYIQTSQCNMFLKNEFDTIYHEHHSFFSANSMNKLVENNNMFIHNIEITDIHGDSFLVTIRKFKTLNSNIIDKVKEEGKKGLHTLSFYENYSNTVSYSMNNLQNKINEYKYKGYKIIGYGAAAKGNTVLNYRKIHLDYIIDDCKGKWGLYTPGMNIKIKSKLDENDITNGKIIIIPLAWNFFNEIYNKVKTANPDLSIIFIKYFPDLEIVS